MIGKCFLRPRDLEQRSWPSPARAIRGRASASARRASGSPRRPAPTRPARPRLGRRRRRLGRRPRQCGSARSGASGPSDRLRRSLSRRRRDVARLGLRARPALAPAGVCSWQRAAWSGAAGLVQLRRRLAAELPGVRAARLEPAGRRQVERVGHGALDRRQPAAALLDGRDRVEQAHRVRGARLDEDLVDRALLDDLAGVHDDDVRRPSRRRRRGRG